MADTNSCPGCRGSGVVGIPGGPCPFCAMLKRAAPSHAEGALTDAVNLPELPKPGKRESRYCNVCGYMGCEEDHPRSCTTGERCSNPAHIVDGPWFTSEQMRAYALASRPAPAAVGEREPKDSERLKWMSEHEARIGWNREGDLCSVWVRADDPCDPSWEPVCGWGKHFDNHRDAIDAAIAATQPQSAGKEST